MVEQEHSYIILARVEAIVSLAVTLGLGGILFVGRANINHMGAVLAAALIGLITVIYYASLHQIIAKKTPQWSALVMSVLSAGAVGVVVEQTGRINSPFFAFWALAIVTAGMFGLIATLMITLGTLGLYVYDLSLHGFNIIYIQDHVVQLGYVLAAAGLALWIHYRGRTARAVQKAKVATIEGKLTAESLKTTALISSIGEGVIVVNAQRQVELFNNAAQTLTGWDEQSAQDIDYSLIFKLKDINESPVAPENDPFGKAMASHGQIIDASLTIETQGGRRIATEFSVSPIYDEHHAVSGAIGLFRDITEQKAVERQKDEFVSTASHEMRTPVAAIEGYLSLAMNPNVAMVDDRAKTYLVKAHDAVTHLGSLFRDLLSVTKAEEGKLQGQAEAVNLTNLVKSAVDDMQFTVQKKNLSLVFQSSSNGEIKSIAPLYYVKGNPERLREVVMNLIDNAVKFTTKGGITVTLTGSNDDTTVSIADTGIGIAPEDAAHLFQKFYRIDSSATRTIGGTGLGLYLCRTVIELSGGKIWVDGKVGVGSTFSFKLPRLTSVEIAKLESETAAVRAAEEARKNAPAAPASAPAATPTAPVTSGSGTTVAASAGPALDPKSATPAVASAVPAAVVAAATEPVSAMAKTNTALTSNPAAAVAAALAAHPPKPKQAP